MAQELGALSVKIETIGDRLALNALQALESRATGAGNAVSTKLTPAQRALNKEIKESTALMSLMGRTADVTDKQMVAGIQQAMVAQIAYADSLGASATQLLQMTAVLQQFEGRVKGAASAEQKATAATGQLGAAVVKTETQLTGFQKKGLTSLNALAFGFSQFAASGEASLRSFAQTVTGIAAFLGPKGAIGAIVGTIALGTTDLILGKINASREKARADQIANAKAELTEVKAALDARQATEDTAFQRGRESLTNYYQSRAKIIEQGIAAEKESRREQVAALNIRLAKLPFERDKDREEAERQIVQLQAEINALDSQLKGQLSANEAAFAQAAKANAALVMQFTHDRMAAEGKAHEVRLEQIQKEADEFFKAMRQANVDPAEASARAQAFVDTMTAQANATQAQLDLQLLLTDLENKRQEIQQQGIRNKTDERDISAQIALVEQSAKKTLEEKVALIAQFAAILKDPELLKRVQELKISLGLTGVNVDALNLEKQIANSIGSAVANGIAEGFATGATEGLGAGAKKLLSGVMSALGSIFVQLGTKVIAGSAIMQSLVTGILSLSPGAQLAAGIALVALGRSMGGRSGGGGTAGVSATATGTPLSVSRLIADPFAGVRPNSSSALSRMSPIGEAANPFKGMRFLIANDPSGKRFLAEMVSNAQLQGA